MSKRKAKNRRPAPQAAAPAVFSAASYGADIWQWGGTPAERALRLSAVWACVRLLSQTVSTLPLKIYRRDDAGGKTAAEDAHWLVRLLTAAPNPWQTPARLFEFLVASLMLRGNAYFEKRIIGSRVVGLLPILPQNVQSIVRQPDGSHHYHFIRDHQNHVLPDRQIWHLRGFGIDGFLGLDSLGMGAGLFDATAAADRSAAKMFDGGMSASGFLKYSNGFLNKEQRAMLQQELNRFSGSANAGKTMILEAGMDYQGITINPASAQLLESRTFSVEEICRWFGVPPVLIGHTTKSSSWGSSIEALFQLFVSTALRPIMVNIEQSIKKDLIPAADRASLFAEFNAEGLLRGDLKSRTEYYSAAVNNGWMSRNDVRAKENLPPMDKGGDTHTVQAALIPIEQVGQNFQQGVK